MVERAEKLFTKVKFLYFIEEDVKSANRSKKFLVDRANFPHSLDPAFDCGNLGKFIIVGEEGFTFFLEEVFELEVEELEEAASVICKNAVDVDIVSVGLLKNFLYHGGFPGGFATVEEDVGMSPDQILHYLHIRS